MFWLYDCGFMGGPELNPMRQADEQTARSEVLHETARCRRIGIHAAPRRRQLLEPLLRRGHQWRHPAVRRIDDERRVPRFAGIVGPEAVVGAGVAVPRRGVVLPVARRDAALIPARPLPRP